MTIMQPPPQKPKSHLLRNMMLGAGALGGAYLGDKYLLGGQTLNSIKDYFGKNFSGQPKQPLTPIPPPSSNTPAPTLSEQIPSVVPQQQPMNKEELMRSVSQQLNQHNGGTFEGNGPDVTPLVYAGVDAPSIYGTAKNMASSATKMPMAGKLLGTVGFGSQISGALGDAMKYYGGENFTPANGWAKNIGYPLTYAAMSNPVTAAATTIGVPALITPERIYSNFVDTAARGDLLPKDNRYLQNALSSMDNYSQQGNAQGVRAVYDTLKSQAPSTTSNGIFGRIGYNPDKWYNSFSKMIGGEDLSASRPDNMLQALLQQTRRDPELHNQVVKLLQQSHQQTQ